MSSNGKGAFTPEQMQAARDLQAARSDRGSRRGGRSGAARDQRRGGYLAPAPAKIGPGNVSTKNAALKEKDESIEEDLMDLRTPISTTGFPSELASKPASAKIGSPTTGAAQSSDTLLDSSTEVDEIGIEALKPRKPPTAADKALNQSLLKRFGGLADSKWAK